MVNIILANVGTIICFRSGNPADEQAVLPMFSPYIEAGEIANLPAFNFFMRMAAIKAQEPLSGITVLFDSDGSNETAQKVIASSQGNYATAYQAIDIKPPKVSIVKPKLMRQNTARALPGE